MTTFAYPPQAANGKLVLSDNAATEAIVSAIQTRKGERVFRNNYGSDLDEFTTINDLDGVLTTLTENIIDSTYDYLPLSLELSGEIVESGNIQVRVEYDDSESSEPQTLTLEI